MHDSASSLASGDLARVHDDPMRHKIDERSTSSPEAVRQQRQMVSIMSTEVVDEQVWRRQDGPDEPEDERRHEQRRDDEEREDRQRRAEEEPDEHDGRHLDGAQPAGNDFAGYYSVLFEPLGG
jgi:hypothetical protein